MQLFTDTMQQLERQDAIWKSSRATTAWAESYRLGAWGADRRGKRGDGEVGGDGSAGRAGDFDKAAEIQGELKSLKELVFSEPIVDAVARIKIILEHEGLIKNAGVRRPQLGIGEPEKEQLLASYRALKENDYRSLEDFNAQQLV